MRVFARQQVHQQFIQVIAAKQRLARQQRLPALPLGLHQGLHLALAGPTQLERLESHQQAAQCRAWASRTARQQRNTAEITREDLDDQARFAKRIGVQHIGWLCIDAFAAAWENSGAGVEMNRARGLPARQCVLLRRMMSPCPTLTVSSARARRCNEARA